MRSDLFHIQASWGPRQETIEAYARRLSRMLNDVSDVHCDFAQLVVDPDWGCCRPAALTYEDHGNQIGVYLGPESLFEPPGIPGTDRAVEEWMEFLDRWAKNPDERWIDAETGRAYGILDLEWQNTLGAGRCSLDVLQPGYLNPLKTTELLSDLTGIPFKFCWYHI